MAVNHFRPNKTPGVDSLTAEFYDKFFDCVAPFLLDAYNFAFKEGKLDIST